MPATFNHPAGSLVGPPLSWQTTVSRSRSSWRTSATRFGLAAYAYTTSSKTAADLGSEIESGMVSINHHGLALPESPFGGVKESGYGSEGGPGGDRAISYVLSW
jgi:succinate-semialdehyde dehydrogenase/glutarate-semialdehyde dehydrogenase